MRTQGDRYTPGNHQLPASLGFTQEKSSQGGERQVDRSQPLIYNTSHSPLSSATLRDDWVPGIVHRKEKETGSLGSEVGVKGERPPSAGFPVLRSLPFQSAELRPPPPAASSPPAERCPRGAQWWLGCPASEQRKQQRCPRYPLWRQEKGVLWAFALAC